MKNNKTIISPKNSKNSNSNYSHAVSLTSTTRINSGNQSKTQQPTLWPLGRRASLKKLRQGVFRPKFSNHCSAKSTRISKSKGSELLRLRSPLLQPSKSHRIVLSQNRKNVNGIKKGQNRPNMSNQSGTEKIKSQDFLFSAPISQKVTSHKKRASLDFASKMNIFFPEETKIHAIQKIQPFLKRKKTKNKIRSIRDSKKDHFQKNIISKIKFKGSEFQISMNPISNLNKVLTPNLSISPQSQGKKSNKSLAHLNFKPSEDGEFTETLKVSPQTKSLSSNKKREIFSFQDTKKLKNGFKSSRRHKKNALSGKYKITRNPSIQAGASLFKESTQFTAQRRKRYWKMKKSAIKRFMKFQNKKYKTQHQLKLSKFKENRELADCLDGLSKKIRSYNRAIENKEAEMNIMNNLREERLEILEYKKQHREMMHQGKKQRAKYLKYRKAQVKKFNHVRAGYKEEHKDDKVIFTHKLQRLKKEKYAEDMNRLEREKQKELKKKRKKVLSIQDKRSNLQVQKMQMIKEKFVKISQRVEAATLMDIYDISIKKDKIAECLDNEKELALKLDKASKDHTKLRNEIDTLFQTTNHRLGKHRQWRYSPLKKYKSKFEIFNMKKEEIFSDNVSRNRSFKGSQSLRPTPRYSRKAMLAESGTDGFQLFALQVLEEESVKNSERKSICSRHSQLQKDIYKIKKERSLQSMVRSKNPHQGILRSTNTGLQPFSEAPRTYSSKLVAKNSVIHKPLIEELSSASSYEEEKNTNNADGYSNDFSHEAEKNMLSIVKSSTLDPIFEQLQTDGSDKISSPSKKGSKNVSKPRRSPRKKGSSPHQNPMNPLSSGFATFMLQNDLYPNNSISSNPFLPQKAVNRLKNISIAASEQILQRNIGFSTLLKQEKDQKVPLQYAVQKHDFGIESSFYIMESDEDEK